MMKDKDVAICGICKASFSCDSFTRFIEHKLLHINANEKIHCFLCLKWFSKRNALQIHLERVHAIPQRRTLSDIDSSNTATASSSARCNPCSSLNSSGSDQRPPANCETLNNCFSSTQLHPSRSDISLSLHQHQEDNNISGIILQGTESSENSNLSVDVLTTDDPVIAFPLNTLNYYEDVCCNRLLVSNEISDKLQGETLFSSGIAAQNYKNESEFTSVKHINDNGNKEFSVVNGKINEKSIFSLMEKEKSQSIVSEINDGDSKAKGGNKEKVEESKINKEKENIDFHFLLGTTSISGNSMRYERVEFRCMHCSFSSAWRPSLMKHMKIAHGDVLAFHEILDIQTATLSKPSSNQSELSKRYKIMKLSEHSKMTLKNKTRKAKRLARAVEYQDTPGKYTCPICNKVFTRIRYMRRHQVTHKTQRTYLCDHCGKSFKTRSTLIAHTRSHNIKVYQCPQCDFVSNLTRAIHCHRQLHPNGSAVCEICGAVYTDKSTLKKHMRVHDPSRPFSCSEPNCTWRFKTESLMKAHVKSHTLEGKFQCVHCGYRFRHKHHLQRHILRIHPQENLVENSSNVPLHTSSNTPIIGPSVSNPDASLQPTGVSEFTQKRDLGFDFSDSSRNLEISLEPGNTHSISCVQNNLQAQEKTTECRQTEQQDALQVLSLVNNNGQEIVISLPADINPDLVNNSIVNLDNTDIMQHINSGQIFIVRESQQ